MSEGDPGAPAVLRAGAVAVSPILLGVVPFGLVWGATVADAGLGLAEAAGFSTILFAGASQLASLDLLSRDAPVVVAIVTALVINLRMFMYAASLAPHLAGESRGRRAWAAYLLTDQAYAVAITRYQQEPEAPRRLEYYLGAALALWVTWQATSLAGVAVGDAIPESVPLEFAVPIVFLALLVPAITDRPTLVAAIVGGAVATVGMSWTANLGMLSGAVVGIGAGTAVALRTPSARP